MKARSKITRDRRKAARLSGIAAGLRSLLSPRATPAAPRSLREHLRFEPLEPRLLLNADPVLVSGAIDSPGESDRYSFALDGETRIAFDTLTNDANINWTLEGPGGETRWLPCGSPIPSGWTCTCNCVAAAPPAPVPTICTCHTVCGCNADVCTCDSVHYWHPC